MEILIFLFKSGLPMKDLLKVSEERAPRFREVEGLVQKFYVSDKESNRIGGIYFFDSKKNLKAFRDSDLAKSTPEAYQFTEPPDVRIFDVLKKLHEPEKLMTIAE